MRVAVRVGVGFDDHPRVHVLTARVL
eukprot:COSAG05_NODE_1965_length_3772_cov_1256.470188_1_plen_25_part_10